MGNFEDMFCQPVYERALLAYCFRDMNNYYEILSMLSTTDFLSIQHRNIYMIIGTLAERGVSKLDPSLIINEADKNGMLEEIGNYDYVNAIINLELDERNLKYYIQRVLDGSTKYQLHKNLHNNVAELEGEATNEEVTSSDFIGKVEVGIMDLSLKSKFVPDAKNLSDGLDEYIEERRANPVEFCGISTGFSILDKRIDGLVPGTLHVVCARPKYGKSTMLSTIASHVAYELGKTVLYIDTEMTFDEYRPRLISMLSGVNERKVKHGGYNDYEYKNIQNAAKIIKKGKLFHEYVPGYSVDKLVALYKKYKYREDIALGVFDYIKSPAGADFQNKKEYQLLGDVTTALKDLCGELNVPFLAANQLSREHKIADSDRIERYADVLMFLQPKTTEEMERGGLSAGTSKLFIKSSRRGGTTPEEGIGLKFFKRNLQLSEAEVQLIDFDNLGERDESGEEPYARGGAVDNDDSPAAF